MEFNIGDIVIGMGLGVVLTIVAFNWAMNRIIRRVESELEESTDNAIGMRIEVDQNIIYCYNSETNQFLCQGRTLTEIADAFVKRFPNAKGYVDGGDPKVIEQWKKELNEAGNHIRSTS